MLRQFFEGKTGYTFVQPSSEKFRLRKKSWVIQVCNRARKMSDLAKKSWVIQVCNETRVECEKSIKIGTSQLICKFLEKYDIKVLKT